MVENQNSINQENTLQSPIDILRRAEKDSANDIVFKMYADNLEAIAKKLDECKTEEKQIEFLKWEFTGLYLLVCDAKGISTEEFRKWCKSLDNEEDYEIWIYYIHGWLVPYIANLRKQGKLQQGRKKIILGKKRNEYDY